MMAEPIPARLRALYRLLLRELPLRPHPTVQQHPLSARTHAPPISLLNSQTPIHKRIRSHISSSPSSSSAFTPADAAATNPEQEQETARSIAAAAQFATYLRAQRMYTTLLERYNPGMGLDETERIRLTARRVGMNLPIEFEGGAGGGGRNR